MEEVKYVVFSVKPTNTRHRATKIYGKDPIPKPFIYSMLQKTIVHVAILLNVIF